MKNTKLLKPFFLKISVKLLFKIIISTTISLFAWVQTFKYAQSTKLTDLWHRDMDRRFLLLLKERIIQ